MSDQLAMDVTAPARCAQQATRKASAEGMDPTHWMLGMLPLPGYGDPGGRLCIYRPLPQQCWELVAIVGGDNAPDWERGRMMLQGAQSLAGRAAA